MSDPLYKKELLRLAADATGAGRLTVPCGSATVHNPACGDKVTVDIAVVDGRIAAIAHLTTACVLTQASAAILGGGSVGLSRVELQNLHASVSVMLEGGGVPGEPFEVYSTFDGVTEYKNRHRCVLLPIEAALAAIAASERGEPGGVGP
jgi:nitrogen fixation protein NifU and related proteins